MARSVAGLHDGINALRGERFQAVAHVLVRWRGPICTSLAVEAVQRHELPTALREETAPTCASPIG